MAHDGRSPITSSPTHQPPEPLPTPSKVARRVCPSLGHRPSPIRLRTPPSNHHLSFEPHLRSRPSSPPMTSDHPRGDCQFSVGSVWSSAVRGGGRAHLELALDCLGGEFTLPGVGDASPCRFSFGDVFLLPPPSYWIGLCRPPPAPNWQQFADDLGRRRPPPKPNWRAVLRPPTFNSRRTHTTSVLDTSLSGHHGCFPKLPTSPPISTTGSHTVPLAVSSRLHFAHNYHVRLPFLLEACALLIRRGSVLSFLGLFLWLGQNILLFWETILYYGFIGCQFLWPFLGPLTLGSCVTEILQVPLVFWFTIYFPFTGFSPTVYFLESINNILSHSPFSFSTLLVRSCTIQSFLVFLSDSLILSSSKSGGL
jgi:hypothetical protein